MKNKIRKYIKKFLGIDALYERILDQDKEIIKLNRIISEHHLEISRINKLTNIGIDAAIHGRDMCWAVICIGGKQPLVRFVELPNDNAKDVLRFCEQFNRQNRLVLDGPIFLRDVYRDQFRY